MKKKLLIIIVSIIPIILITIYMMQGEWVETYGSYGDFGENTYYDGGTGLYEIEKDGMKIKISGYVISGSVTYEILDSEEKTINSFKFTDEINQEVFISGKENKVIYDHTYTDDKGEASVTTISY